MKIKFTILVSTFLCCSILSFGQAINFDGIDDYVQTTYAGINGTNNRTIEAWIRTTGNFVPNNGGSQGVLVDYGTFINGQRFTFNVLWANAIRLEVGGNGISGTIPVNDGSWHHVAVVFSNPGNTIELYVDGVLDTQGSLTIPVNTGTTNDIMIGRRIDGLNYFEGDIDEVRIWNTALTQATIQANMNSELCNANGAGLLAYYQFNDGTPNGSNSTNTTAIDNSGNWHDGTLNNFALSGNSSNWVTGAPLTSSGGTNTFATISTSNCGSYTLPSGSQTVTTSGMYMDTIPNTQCGDSILTINVTINNNTSSSPALTVCNSYIAPNGDTYTSSQIINYTIPNAAGCDSLISLNLTVLNPTSSITETSCGAYTSPSGMVVTTSQVFTDVIPSVDGCDSTITIDLTIVEIDSSVSFTTGDTTLLANETNPNATYQWYECLNGALTMIQGATNQNYTPVSSGFYAVEVGLNGCSNTSACTEFILDNTENQYLQSMVNIFPNPTNGDLIIDLGDFYQDIQIEIYSFDGKMIVNQSFKNQQQINTTIEAISGLYQIKIKTEKGVVNKIILKE